MVINASVVDLALNRLQITFPSTPVLHRIEKSKESQQKSVSCRHHVVGPCVISCIPVGSFAFSKMQILALKPLERVKPHYIELALIHRSTQRHPPRFTVLIYRVMSEFVLYRVVLYQDNCKFSNVFCENSQKLVNVQFFALAAKYHSLPSLEVCTPLEQMLGALSGKQHKRCEIKTDEFMNNKKSHEVQKMSELIDSIANFCGIKQVIDLGSGKGYLSSFLSMQYNLKVYGIDSSNTNTYGANERNRKLKKHWGAYQSRARANVRGQMLEEPKDRAVQDEIKCKANISEKLLSTNNSLLSQDQTASSDSVPLEITGAFTDSAMLKTGKQTEPHLVTQTQSDGNKISENAFSLLNILPADAVEAVSSSKCNMELCEEEKERRKMASIKAKASKSNDSNIYLPLTSYITAETELRDIITDLEDCIMVGLHTCGDLAPNTLRIFTAKPEIKAVCSVGCCYHLLTEEFENQKEMFLFQTKPQPQFCGKLPAQDGVQCHMIISHVLADSQEQPLAYPCQDVHRKKYFDNS
ncbi:Putative protein C12orf26 [Chelonia mydas]|uniref:Methyltransferase domain-containing protein n=1 Tax=Chelonia mydas TaxID=8469 RepID=M7B330_CHEMY|nr:Putative protein C12orf26 [Chelonia mydas]